MLTTAEGKLRATHFDGNAHVNQARRFLFCSHQVPRITTMQHLPQSLKHGMFTDLSQRYDNNGVTEVSQHEEARSRFCLPYPAQESWGIKTTKSNLHLPSRTATSEEQHSGVSQGDDIRDVEVTSNEGANVGPVRQI